MTGILGGDEHGGGAADDGYGRCWLRVLHRVMGGRKIREATVYIYDTQLRFLHGISGRFGNICRRSMMNESESIQHLKLP